MIDADRISELRRLEAEATPGPWELFDTALGIGVTTDISDIAHCHGFDSNKDRAELLANAALIVALRNALPELLKALEWQPIETAPKDGTNILVYSLEGEQVAWWSEGWNKFLTTGGRDVLWDEPTHWMTLPLPPHGGVDVG